MKFSRLKRIGLLSLLTCYLCSLSAPMLPFVDYFVNFEYISEVLCINKDKPELKCQGKCHLVNELKKNQNKEDASSSFRIPIEKLPWGIIVSNIVFEFRQDQTWIDELPAYIKLYTFLKFGPQSPPPIF